MKFRGDEVRRQRLYKGMSTDELARAAGITRQQVLKLEAGGVMPRSSTARGIAEALGVELSSLYEDAV